MLMNSWLKNLKARFGRAPAKPSRRPKAYRPVLEALEDRCLLSTFTVLNTDDSGAGSLRQAILDANATAGQDLIAFNISAVGVQTISPTSPLPTITDPVILDGTTQPGFAGTPVIELNGTSAVASFALDITAGSSTVRGLAINRFGGGIQLQTNGSNVVEGNFIGTNAAGTAALGNGMGPGVTILSANNTVGGTSAGGRNLISGHRSSAVFIFGAGASGNLVQGNYLGTDITGNIVLLNSAGFDSNGSGVSISSASNNTIGGTTAAARNIIAGNGLGISMTRPGATGPLAVNNVIQGNYIGLNAAGTAALGNTVGIHLDRMTNTTVGGTTEDARNVISGNRTNGIKLQFTAGAGTLVQGNYIGLNAAGTAALGNGAAGIQIDSASNNMIRGNVISGNLGQGVSIGGVGTFGTGNLIEGNHIGTNAAGTAAVGNRFAGVQILTANNTVGGTTAAAGNVISGNGFEGVTLSQATGTLVQGNYIGTNAVGTALGNARDGVLIDRGSNNTVGGTVNGAGNVIAFNGRDGVFVQILGTLVATGNAILSNSIHSNTGLGIDLNPDGMNLNDLGDADTGANNRQNFPVLTSAVSTATATTIQGTLNSMAGTLFWVEFFANASSDPSGFGEGQSFLGFTTVTIDASGATANFTVTLPVAVPAGQVVSATATDPTGNTSEFSLSQIVVLGNRSPLASPDPYSVNEDGTLTVAGPGVLGNDSDPDGNPLTAVLVSGPAHGALTLSTNGSFHYTPSADFHGLDSFTYKANDGVLDSAAVTVTITVISINDVPVAVDDVRTTDEDVPVTIAVLVNDFDVDDAAQSAAPFFSFASQTVASDASGPLVISIGGTNFFAFQNLDAGSGSATAIGGFTSLVGLPPGDLTFTLGDLELVDFIGTPTTATQVYAEGDGNIVPFEIFRGGTLAASGSDMVITIVTDRDPSSPTFGVANGFVQVTLTGVAGDPFFEEVLALTSGTGRLRAMLGSFIPTTFNDPETFASTGAFMLNRLVVSAVTNGANGAVAIAPGGATVTYTPNANFHGTDSFTYTISDPDGSTATATVTVTVNAINDAPAANAGGAYTVAEGGSVSLTGLGTDPDAGDSLTYQWDLDNNGTFETAGPSPTFSAAGLDGPSSRTVTLRVTDAGGLSSQSTATVHVTNVAPTAVNDSAMTNEDQLVTVAVLSNDSDPAGALDPLRIDSVTNGAKGATSIDTKGTADTTDDEIVYTPNAGATGSDSFTYTIGDGDGGTATATVNVEIGNLVDVSGRVFDDKDNDGVYEPGDGEIGIGGVIVQLFNETSTTQIATQTTASDGTYRFDVNLGAGTYTIVAAQPTGFLDGSETAGNLGGAVDNTQDSNQITAVSLGEPGTTPDAIDYLFAEIRPSQAQGLVWRDADNDGQVDFGEAAIQSAAIELSGLDDRGHAVNRSALTDVNGIFAFIDLRPSDAAGYTIHEVQPAGCVDGVDVVGTVNGATVGISSVNDVFSAVVLPRPGSLAENYNFGERPTLEGGVSAGQTATIGFWQNKNGQNLIKALNGGSTSTQLGNWLASNFVNMYGAGAGANNMADKTNAQVAALYKTLFARTAATAAGGGPAKMDAQVMATAFAVYVTNQALAGTTAASFGFQVTENGVGTRTFNVSTNGVAVGVADNSLVAVLDLLLAVNCRSKNGLLFDLDGDGAANDTLETSWRTMANNVFSAINEAGDI